MRARQLRVTEIFHSLQGETSRTGLPTVFVRLTGCPLRCTYCDTEYAFYGGQSRTIPEILNTVASFNSHYVTVTGGEPLAQKETPWLLKALCDAGYSVSLETSGAFPIVSVDPRVSRIMDIKTPGSNYEEKNLWSNLDYLNEHDEIKFVLCDEIDYQWASAQIAEKKLAQICPILFSPVHDKLHPTQLAEWILRDRLPVRMQIQLHKLLWGASPGH